MRVVKACRMAGREEKGKPKRESRQKPATSRCPPSGERAMLRLTSAPCGIYSFRCRKAVAWRSMTSAKEKGMKKILVMLLTIGLGAVAASASGGVGIFGTYWDADDPGPAFGGGVKFKADLAEYFAVELRASCATKFDDWEGDDELYVIPLEAGLMFTLPLGDEVPITLYGGGGGGYAIIPEADDIDFDDDFCFFGLGGVEIALGEAVSLFVEAQYRFLEVDGADVDGEEIDYDDELKFTGVCGNAGLLFRF